jgi:hypothetical protein
MSVKQLYPVASDATYSTTTPSYATLDPFKVSALDFWPCSGVWPDVRPSGTVLFS